MPKKKTGHEILTERLIARLLQQTRIMPCECVPYGGGHTKAFHWDSCPWCQWLEVFEAAASVAGVTLPDLRITAEKKAKEGG